MAYTILTGTKELNIWEEATKHDLTLKLRNPFKPYYHPSWFKSINYITIPNRKELIHGDFGKDKIPYFPIRGSIIGDCINMKNQEWKNGMNYNDFRRYVLQDIYKSKEEDLTHLFNLLKNLTNDNRM